ADPRTSAEVRRRVEMLRADLDPVCLLAEIRAAQQRLVQLADDPMPMARVTPDAPPAIAAFLAGLRTAWHSGEVRPTAQAKPKQKRGCRRPDPVALVTDELQAWFEADPSRTGGELLARQQAAYPGRYSDGLLRTVQRRLKGWRGEIASALVFGAVRPPGSAAALSGTWA
ncbi:MAG: transposase, partial [Hyphomicrobium sp.]|nr:transposase [Hyphomicrobium sp.]